MTDAIAADPMPVAAGLKMLQTEEQVIEEIGVILLIVKPIPAGNPQAAESVQNLEIKEIFESFSILNTKNIIIGRGCSEMGTTSTFFKNLDSEFSPIPNLFHYDIALVLHPYRVTFSHHL